jgi:hypothetical protein
VRETATVPHEFECELAAQPDILQRADERQTTEVQFDENSVRGRVRVFRVSLQVSPRSVFDFSGSLDGAGESPAWTYVLRYDESDPQ